MSSQIREFDKVLTVIGNPVRRRIIQRLSEEVGYPLELSGDLGINQQLVAKHLKVLEDAAVVEAKKESSPRGPDRRMYGLTKGVSLTIDFSPGLYGARMFSFENFSLSSEHDSVGEFEERFDRLSGSDKFSKEIDPYADLIADIDARVGELESERDALLYVRSQVMRAAKECLRGNNVSSNERMVIHHILNRNEKTSKEISGSLGVSRFDVAETLKRLRSSSVLR